MAINKVSLQEYVRLIPTLAENKRRLSRVFDAAQIEYEKQRDHKTNVPEWRGYTTPWERRDFQFFIGIVCEYAEDVDAILATSKPKFDPSMCPMILKWRHKHFIFIKKFKQ